MANFAKIENNIITNVIVIDDSDCAGGMFPESEQAGKTFIASLGLDGEWLQTSPEIRKQYGSVGMQYLRENDVFIFEKPYASWSLDQNFDWQPPVPHPPIEEGKLYAWDEATISWISFEKKN